MNSSSGSESSFSFALTRRLSLSEYEFIVLLRTDDEPAFATVAMQFAQHADYHSGSSVRALQVVVDELLLDDPLRRTERARLRCEEPVP